MSAVSFLGTPLWHYGRTLFTESFIGFFVIGAYSLFITKKASLVKGALLPGLLLGFAVTLKPPIVLCALPLCVHQLIFKRWKSLFGLAVGPALGICVFGWSNYLITGSPFLKLQPAGLVFFSFGVSPSSDLFKVSRSCAFCSNLARCFCGLVLFCCGRVFRLTF